MDRRHFLSLVPAAAIAQSTRSASRPDWTQWHGPDGANISREVGLLKQWPSSGPKLVWSARGLGNGYGSISIQADRIYVQGAQGSQSVVFALDRASGKHVWIAPLGRALDQDRGVDRAARPPSMEILFMRSVRMATSRPSAAGTLPLTGNAIFSRTSMEEIRIG